MQPAQPSRRERLSPQDITATLRKVHGIASPDEATQEDDIAQVDLNPLWHGMAMDLMLGNLEQPLWGWADPDAITTLNYWSELDPRLTFVLVYDEPHRVLMEASVRPSPPTLEDTQRLLDNWAAYNGTLLRFYLRHRDRCLLVHAQQVRREAGRYVQQLQPMLDAALNQLPEQSPADLPVLAQTTRVSPALVPAQRLNAIAALTGLDSGLIEQTLRANDTERYLLDDILRTTHPLSLQRYAELQASASLPLDPPLYAPTQATPAWTAWVQQRALMANLANRLHSAYQQVSAELDDAQRHHARLTEQHRAQLSQLQNQHQQSLNEQEKEIQRSREEAELLQGQLHQVQEELEQHYLRKQELEKRTDELDAELKRQNEAHAKALKARLENAGQEQIKSLHQENETLLGRLHQAQEELERFYLENQHLKMQQTPAKPPLYGAAERVKQQLDYRLGSVMIKKSHTFSGWVGMPLALIAEARLYRKEMKQIDEKNLPPIHEYYDSEKAEQTKKHLSYRLGFTLLNNYKTPFGWTKLPFLLTREISEFRRRKMQ
ncbi:hypothetical protein CEK28_13445 [Xenophilus sp. AP218F]|nr:hypothetical protein CEK28_13445 [Xenophilus sp. AP218F]